MALRRGPMGAAAPPPRVACVRLALEWLLVPHPRCGAVLPRRRVLLCAAQRGVLCRARGGGAGAAGAGGGRGRAPADGGAARRGAAAWRHRRCCACDGGVGGLERPGTRARMHRGKMGSDAQGDSCQGCNVLTFCKRRVAIFLHVACAPSCSNGGVARRGTLKHRRNTECAHVPAKLERF